MSKKDSSVDQALETLHRATAILKSVEQFFEWLGDASSRAYARYDASNERDRLRGYIADTVFIYHRANPSYSARVGDWIANSDHGNWKKLIEATKFTLAGVSGLLRKLEHESGDFVLCEAYVSLVRDLSGMEIVLKRVVELSNEDDISRLNNLPKLKCAFDELYINLGSSRQSIIDYFDGRPRRALG
ncbi:hypothetical protein M2352_001812 [Azospirillum fermentarium]|uniref:hypothetical protein n=1 Tax=Azospirillum fermentarium TaxID=1233114 RepID=UPI002227C973|nr:hypothetical protein [Azospirillum fermentarium]MCW2246221.1 hypothetical protein [Azospirillum fermentarium]